jgi:hypothetical protein
MLSILALIAVSAAVAAPRAGTAAGRRITPHGVGPVKLGATFKHLHGLGLVGRLIKGCELSGPQARAARLKLPLKGSVDFTHSTPRTVADITLRGGASARGVGIGATIGQIQAAFPAAVIDHSTEATFGITLVKIPRRHGGRLQFGVDVNTHEVILIGIPFIPFCD